MNIKKAILPFSAFMIASTISSAKDADNEILDFLPDYHLAHQQNQQEEIPDFVPVLEARNVKEKHQQELNLKKEHHKSRWKKWSLGKYKEKMKHKFDSKKIREEKRKIIKEKFGDEYQFNLTNDIAKCASKLIEKHYAGTASFIEGTGYLKKLQDILTSPNTADSELESLFQHCQDSLTIYKKDKKSKKIRRDKIFTNVQKIELNEKISEIFANQPEMVALLEKAYNSNLECHNPKGFTLGLAFGLGGYGGAYRQKCRTPLGRRFKIYKSHGGLNWGAGGVASTSLAGNISHKPRVTNHSSPHKVKFDHNSAAALALGAGVDVTVPGGVMKKVAQSEESAKRNASKVAALVSPAVGLGVYFGVFGLSGETKREIQPDFEILFNTLGILKDTPKPIEYSGNPFED